MGTDGGTGKSQRFMNCLLSLAWSAEQEYPDAWQIMASDDLRGGMHMTRSEPFSQSMKHLI
jgi:hypothetical protein